MLNENQNLKKEETAKDVIPSDLVKVSKENNVLATSNSDDFNSIEFAVKQLENMKQLASIFVQGSLCPLKKEEDVIIAIITGNQLGLPYTTSINNIFPIKGKPAMSTHLIRALLLTKGVIFNKDYDYEPLYSYYEAEEVDGKLVAKKIANVPIFRGTAPLSEIDQTKFIAGAKEVDKLTQYTFTRKLRQPDGSYETVKVVSKFKMSDASTAGLLDNKDNWEKYPSRMCDARCFNFGAREIASDIIFGLYSISELADTYDIPYEISNTLEEKVVYEANIIKDTSPSN